MNKQEKEVIQSQLDDEKQALKDLERQYQRALRDINERIRILQSEDTPSRAYQASYQKTLKAQVEAILEKLHADEYDTMSQYLSKSYTSGYVGTMYTMGKRSGVHVITPLDQKAAAKAIVTDSKLSTDLYASLGYDMDILKKRVREEITRGIATSLPYEQIARNVSNYTTLPLSNANRIVRTEGHRIQQASADDARNAAKAKGADVVKQWDASLDGATRPLHRQLDGQIRETDEPFEAGGKKVMYPGKFNDPSQDCNCRCVALTRARWALDEKELETLKERAEFFGLDKTESFKEYEEKYLKAAEAPVVHVVKNAMDFAYGDYTGDDYVKWAEHYDEINRNVHLSAKELEVIDNYTEGAYISYNASSRGQEDSLLKQGYTAEDMKRIRKDTDILEGALAKYNLDTDIVTHRFERDVSWLTGNGNDVASLEKLVGTHYTAKGFTSSGMLPNRFRFTGGKTDAVHFEIVTPEGTNGAFLSMSKKGEEEFLYNRNTKFIVLDGGERIVKESKFNIKTMQMEEVDVKERFLKVQVVTGTESGKTTKAAKVSGKTDADKVEKPQETAAEIKKKKAIKFTPAKNIEEAESAIKKYCDDKQFGALGVSYSGVSLDMANEVNKALVPLFETYDVGSIGGIIAPAGNTKLGKQMTSALAGYSPIRKSFILNRKSLKNLKTAQAAFDAEGAAIRNLLEHPEQYDFTKLPKYVLSVIERSKKSGRATVPRTVEEALQHEFGHFLERKVFASELWNEAEKNMSKYADGISGYAGTNKSEYVAESFVSFMKGEEVVDPVLVKIFDGLRRK